MLFVIIMKTIWLVHIGLVASNFLDDYVNNDDDLSVVKYNLIQVTDETEYTTYLLNATTLKWFDESFSNSFIWWHYLHIYVPKTYVGACPAFFHIENGNMNDQRSNLEPQLVKLALQFNCVTASIKQIPNQPIVFKNDPLQKSRIEDDIIGYTFSLFFNDRDSFPNTYQQLPLLLPMTKAVKRGMDIIQMFMRDQKLVAPEKFILSGVSKRGWTAWLTAAAQSERVVAIVPIVFDLINGHKCLHDQYKSLGGAYSFALSDYYLADLSRNLDELSFYDLFEIIDPYNYFERYSQMKIMLTVVSSDEFMPNQNLKNFWKDLTVQTRETCVLRRLPNTSHGKVLLQSDSIFANFRNFFYLNGQNEMKQNLMPKVVWKFGNNATHGVIQVQISQLTSFDGFEIRAYKADTFDQTRIDFRAHKLNRNFEIVEQNVVWRSELIAHNYNFATKNSQQLLKFEYAVNRQASQNVYTSFYLNIMLKLNKYALESPIIPDDHLLVLSTETNTIPEYYPHEDCIDSECQGRLV